MSVEAERADQERLRQTEERTREAQERLRVAQERAREEQESAREAHERARQRTEHVRQWISVIGTVLVGLAGISLSYVISTNQTKLQEVRVLEQDLKLLIEEFRFHVVNLMPKKLADMDHTEITRAGMHYDLALAAAEELNRRHQKSDYLRTLSHIVARQPILARIIESDAKRDLKTAAAVLKTAAGALPQSASELNEWFSVIGSYKRATDLDEPKSQAKEAARKLEKVRPKTKTQMHVYQARSGHTVVTIGGVVEEQQARELAALARSIGLADGAYPQPNHDWRLIAKCSKDRCNAVSGRSVW